MATRVRPFVMTGAALASAATIVATAPAIVPTHDVAIGYGNPSVSANYELAALTDITIQGIIDAYWDGYGGFIGPSDPYFPVPAGAEVSLNGIPGVLYYLSNTAVGTPAPNLLNYYFESGGIASVIYVAAQRAGAPWSTIVTAIQYWPQLIASTIVNATSSIPEFDIGPVKVGGGILASLFFTGATPNGSYDYGSPGVPAILGYVFTSLSGGISSSSAPAPVTALFDAKSADTSVGDPTPTVTSLVQDQTVTEDQGSTPFNDPLGAPKISIGGVKDSLAGTGLTLPKIKLGDLGLKGFKPGKTEDGTTTETSTDTTTKPDASQNPGNKFEPRIKPGRHAKPEEGNAPGPSDGSTSGSTDSGSTNSGSGEGSGDSSGGSTS